MVVYRIYAYRGSCEALLLRLSPGELVASTSKWTGFLMVLEGVVVEMSFNRTKKECVEPRTDVEQPQPYDLVGGVLRAVAPGIVGASGHNPSHLAAHHEPPRDLKLLWSEVGAVALLALEGEEFTTVEYAGRLLRIPQGEMEQIPQLLREKLNVEWVDPFGRSSVGAEE